MLTNSWLLWPVLESLKVFWNWGVKGPKEFGSCCFMFFDFFFNETHAHISTCVHSYLTKYFSNSAFLGRFVRELLWAEIDPIGNFSEQRLRIYTRFQDKWFQCKMLRPEILLPRDNLLRKMLQLLCSPVWGFLSACKSASHFTMDHKVSCSPRIYGWFNNYWLLNLKVNC